MNRFWENDGQAPELDASHAFSARLSIHPGGSGIVYHPRPTTNWQKLLAQIDAEPIGTDSSMFFGVLNPDSNHRAMGAPESVSITQSLFEE